MPETLTEEQLEFFTRQTERAVNKTLRHYKRRSIVAFLILLVGIGYAIRSSAVTGDQAREAIVRSGRVVAVDGCNRDYSDRVTVRGVLQASRAFQREQLRRGDITQERYELSIAFYDSQLARLPLPDCRRALLILTDNPERTTPIPVPLHP